MRQFLIPAIFLQSIAVKGNLYSRLWVYWLGSENVDEIFNADFLEKQVKELSKFVKESEIREIYHYGVQFLQQDFKIIERKKEKAEKPVSDDIKEIVEKTIEYLNVQTGSTFKAKGENMKLISGRIAEGYSLADFKLVIDKKVADWKGSDYEKFLRPLTLFAKTKFENYLNMHNAKSDTSNNYTKFSQSVQRAKELINLHKY